MKTSNALKGILGSFQTAAYISHVGGYKKAACTLPTNEMPE
ncbi:MAG: hypothetical protein NTW28_36400 [Candidatus Solibacter sp.]|nr:hypothetical protein [Candidatus Solibacter sp.]